MRGSRAEHFAAGVRLAWLIDPKHRSAEVVDSVEHSRACSEDQTLDGANVLPGFAVTLKDLLAKR